LNIDSPPIIENSEMQALDAFRQYPATIIVCFSKKAAQQLN